MSTETSIPQPKHPWERLGYEPVRGLIDRVVSRYLRRQRRNMRHLLRERGQLDLAERLQQIRKSRQGMLAKNLMFQKVLNEYAQRVNPQGASAAPATEAPSNLPSGIVDVQVTGAVPSDSDDQSRPGDSVPEVASPDGAGVVIEE